MALSLILPVANDFLPLPSGQICPDIRTRCPDGDLRALRAALARSRLLASPGRFLVRADGRTPGSHEDLDEATAPSPPPSPPSTHGGGSDDSASATMRGAAEPRGRKSTAAEPRARHQRLPGIAGNATLQSPVPVPRAPPREGEEAAMPPMPVNSGGHCCYGMCELWA